MTIRFMNQNAAPVTNQAQFATVPQADIQRSQFDRSHTRKQTINADYLYPFYYDEVLPGDTFNARMYAVARLQPTVKPIMDNLYCDVFFVYVPNRLLSSKWEGIMGQQPDPDTDVSSYALTPLKFENYDVLVGSLHDYLGIRPQYSTVSPFDPIPLNKEVSPLYHLAYNFTWNELFRDENLQDPVYFDPAEPTSYDPDDFVLLKRGKRFDYFTSSLPWPQKGPDVLLPLGTTAPVIGTGQALGFTNGSVDFGAAISNGGNGLYRAPNAFGAAIGSPATLVIGSGNVAVGITSDPDNSGLQTDLSAALSPSINAIREAFQVQRLFERDARGGTRYIESLLSHFGVVSPDFRLQRPEYLGGGSTRITISPIPQLSNSGSTPLGNLGAVGHFQINGAGFVKSFVEHGVILGLMAIRADLTYQQGLHRSYNRFTRLDFAWPVLAHLGEQEVLNQEIFMQGDTVMDGTDIVDYKAFGFQERYAEYRYRPSEICGEFRSDYPQSLDVWHLAQDFANLPVLNDEFIESDTPLDRVISVTDQDQFEVDIAMKLICARPLPVHGVPGFVDHF